MDRIKIFIVLTIAFFAVFLSCKKEKSEEVSSPEIERTSLEEPDTQSWQKEITLDNGKKWIANGETTSGIGNMVFLINDSSPSTLQEYRQLGEALNEEKNLLIKRCTMEGPPHDNLHIYLQPLIAKIADLQKTTSSENGQEKVEEIRKHLEEYQNYFM